MRRPRGEVFVSIPQALVFGMDGNSRNRAYCSPQINAVNSSHKTVEELIVGIRYKGSDDKYVGSTTTRFFLLKVGRQDTFYFYSSINAKYCDGLTGDLEVTTCVYEDGTDCSGDVQVIGHGAIPLRMHPPANPPVNPPANTSANTSVNAPVRAEEKK